MWVGLGLVKITIEVAYQCILCLGIWILVGLELLKVMIGVGYIYIYIYTHTHMRRNNLLSKVCEVVLYDILQEGRVIREIVYTTKRSSSKSSLSFIENGSSGSSCSSYTTTKVGLHDKKYTTVFVKPSS